MEEMQGALESSGLNIPEMFMNWTGESIAGSMILFDTLKNNEIELDDKYNTPYRRALQLLESVEDFDITYLKTLLDRIAISNTNPYVGDMLPETTTAIRKETKRIRGKMKDIKNAISLIQAPGNTTLRRLYEALKYYGMSRPISLLQIGDIKEFFSLNPMTITYEGNLAESIGSLLGNTDDIGMRGWLSQLYFYSQSKTRSLKLMGS